MLASSQQFRGQLELSEPGALLLLALQLVHHGSEPRLDTPSPPAEKMF